MGLFLVLKKVKKKVLFFKILYFLRVLAIKKNKKYQKKINYLYNS